MSILDSIKGDGDVVEEKELAVKHDAALDSRVDMIMQVYDAWPGKCQDRFRKDEFENNYQELSGIIINPVAIDEFCQRIKKHRDTDTLDFKSSGFFISAMLQNAYDNGHNDFYINTHGLKNRLWGIGAHVRGREHNPIRVKIGGDTEDLCGWDAEHAQFRVMGNADRDCGFEAKHSIFTLMCNAGIYSGNSAYNCRFIFMGAAGKHCGIGSLNSHYTFMGNAAQGCGDYAEHSSFMFHGDMGDSCGYKAKNSRFHSPDIDILKKIKDTANISCRFYLIEPDGKYKEVLK